MNPGGSVKDRVALNMVKEGLESGILSPGGLITEGTVGSTGVSLAMVRVMEWYSLCIQLVDWIIQSLSYIEI